MNAIEALAAIKDVIAKLDAPIATPTPATPPPTASAVYPRIEKISGVNMLLKAPLNALYHPSAQDWVLGHGDGTHIFDPSNGDEVGMPLRNEQGFPLVYAVGMDKNGKKIAVGEPRVEYGAFGEPTPAQQAANKAEWDHWAEVFKANLAAQNNPPTGDVDVPLGTEP